MAKIEPLYVARVHASGGRDGAAAADDGRLSVKLSTPKPLGGPGGDGTNPEQLFAAGYAACFLSALKFVAARDKVAAPANAAIDSAVGIGRVPSGFGLNVEMKISLPGLAPAVADRLIAEADKVCPYSNATRGNIEVRLSRA
jgi:Ohr subfamily peroxiredoxin